MKKRASALALALVLLSALIFTGCGKESGDSGKGENSDLRVAVVCSGSGQNDNGYNQSACEGIEEAAKKLAVNIKLSNRRMECRRHWKHWQTMAITSYFHWNMILMH